MWFADSCWTFEDSDVTQSKTGSSIAPPQQLRRFQERQKQSCLRIRNRYVILHQPAAGKLHWNRTIRDGVMTCVDFQDGSRGRAIPQYVAWFSFIIRPCVHSFVCCRLMNVIFWKRADRSLRMFQLPRQSTEKTAEKRLSRSKVKYSIYFVVLSAVWGIYETQSIALIRITLPGIRYVEYWVLGSLPLLPRFLAASTSTSSTAWTIPAVIVTNSNNQQTVAIVT